MGIHNFSNVTVPLYDTISNDDMHFITNLCELPLMFVDIEEKTKRGKLYPNQRVNEQ